MEIWGSYELYDDPKSVTAGISATESGWNEKKMGYIHFRVRILAREIEGSFVTQPAAYSSPCGPLHKLAIRSDNSVPT